MKLWLDDIRPAPEGWIWAKSVAQAKQFLNEENVEEISFDHDLGENVPSGYDLACYLEMSAAKGIFSRVPKKWHVHSANPVGRKHIQAAMAAVDRFRGRQAP